jgi:hypothetical protein
MAILIAVAEKFTMKIPKIFVASAASRLGVHWLCRTMRPANIGPCRGPAFLRNRRETDMEAGKRQTMATIVLEGERLLNLARASGSHVVANLIQAVVTEAKAALDGRPSDSEPDVDSSNPSSVVMLRQGKKPPSRLN